MSKHTPGPWLMDVGKSHDGEVTTVLGAPKKNWTTIYSPESDGTPFAEEGEANARLIAKAPEMYELLKRIEAAPALADVFSDVADGDMDNREWLGIERDACNLWGDLGK